MKITLNMAPVNGGPFNCLPARAVELEAERVLCNDVVLPWERHPYNMRLWVIGNEFGALGAVWASNEQDALDELIDRDLGAALLIDEKDYAAMPEDEREDVSHLGNAGEPCDLTNVWIQVVSFDKARDCELLCKFAEARGATQDTLDN